MIELFYVKEMFKKENESIRDYLCDGVNYDKTKLIKYMKNQRRIGSCSAECYDVITGEVISQGFLTYSNGKYNWGDFIYYYIEKYNIKIPQDLIESANAQL